MNIKHNNNDGYSMVELIIVLAMIAVLSGAAMLTLSSVSAARASSARDSFDQEIATLQTKTKSQSSDTAIKIVKEDGVYNIYYGTSKNGTDFTANDASKADVTLDKAVIYYTAEGGSEVELSSQIIKFRKSDGSVVTGSGTYKFCKRNSNKSIGTVTINKTTGSHYTGA